ncbi:hypothetical protein HPP92_011736 [Vanilla planifolia]|uniref:Uncharacterized protein n=1 Tax=Vanilla planifolia TaxID=51239 RepID=A0A835V335_VANPL|nr:hypothetical protein HPP92_011736 [Vanilla planifolia]
MGIALVAQKVAGGETVTGPHPWAGSDAHAYAKRRWSREGYRKRRPASCVAEEREILTRSLRESGWGSYR